MAPPVNFVPGPQHVGFGNQGMGYPVRFDENVPAGVDPEALWKFASSDRGKRHGSTTAERAGKVAGYTPGYGRSAAGNTGQGLTPRPQWDANFEQRLTPAAQADHRDWLWPTGGAATPEHPGMGAIPSQVSTMPASAAPPAASPSGGIPPPGPAPVLPPATNPPPMSSPGDAAHPIQQTATPYDITRSVTNLPAGNTASANFAQPGPLAAPATVPATIPQPGVPNPATQAKRPSARPPIDPFS